MRDTAVFLCTLMLVFAACGCSRTQAADSPPILQEEEMADKGGGQMRVYVTSNGNTIVYGLNDCQAAMDLYAQLPLTIEVEDYSTNEKIFYPPELGTVISGEEFIEALSGSVEITGEKEPAQELNACVTKFTDKRWKDEKI